MFIRVVSICDWSSAIELRFHNIGAGGVNHLGSAYQIYKFSEKRIRQFFIRSERKTGVQHVNGNSGDWKTHFLKPCRSGSR